MKKYSRKKVEKEVLVEVLDNQGETMLLMPLSTCVKKRLPRKIALVVMRNSQNKILLQMYSEKNSNNSGLWDISIYSNVYAHESFADAALREIQKQFALPSVRLYEKVQIPYLDGKNTPLLATFFTTSQLTIQEEKLALNTQATRSPQKTMFADVKELKALISHSPELFTPELIWAVQAGWME